MSENPQRSLPFGKAFTPEEEYGTSMLALHDAYTSASNIVIAGATGIDKADLPKMFAPGSARHLRYSAVFHIGTYASMELRRRALRPLARCWGLDICDPKPPKTEAERNAEFVAEAQRLAGPLAAMIMAKVDGKGDEQELAAVFLGAKR